VNGLLQRFDAWFHTPVPPERLALLRIGIGGYALIYLLSRIGDLLAPVKYPPSSFSPVGVVRLLSAPLPAIALYALYGASILFGALFVAGVGYRWVAPLFGALLLWLLSYRHAWGMIFHTDNLLALHVLLLACAPAADVYCYPSRAARARPDAAPGWVVRAICLVTVASYLVAGVAKLKIQGWHWIGGDALREQIAYDALRKIELGSLHSPLGPWLLPHAALFPPLSAFALAAELLAPLALIGGPFAAVWCAMAWLFHLGVLGTMAIVFPYPISGCAFLGFFPLERGWKRLGERFPRLRPGERGPAP
jgi:hypothetical protein